MPVVIRACQGFRAPIHDIIRDAFPPDNLARAIYVQTATILLQVSTLSMHHWRMGHKKKLREPCSYDDELRTSLDKLSKRLLARHQKNLSAANKKKSRLTPPRSFRA
jgi:hypothetical protein